MPQNTSISIILVRPQMGENIGAAARAMLNFGLVDLRIVAPRDGWPNQKAIDMSAGAFDILPPPRIFDTLAGAIADLHKVYATTARRRDMVKPVFSPETAAQALSEKEKTGFVFGAERSGLENDEIALCHGIINIQTNPEFSSLNLGQSVLLIANALSQTTQSHKHEAASLPYGDSFPVTQDKLEEFLIRLEGTLEDGGFFKARDLKPTMLRNIRAIFTRNNLSDQEVRTLHGVVSAMIGQKKSR